MSGAKVAKGTQLKIGDGGGTEVFTTIGEVTSYGGPTRAAGVIDVTNFDSTAKEFFSDALVDNGEVTFDCNWVTSNVQQEQLIADTESGVLRNFRLILSDTTQFAFAAFVTKVDGPMAGGVAEVYKLSVSLKISGTITPTYV